MKKLFKVFTLLFTAVILSVGVSAKNFPTPDSRLFVNDFANVIDSETENEIYELGKKLDYATKSQVAVVTVNSIGGKDPSKYALDLGNEWGLGDKDKDNGVVILLVLDDRAIEIATGTGIGGALPASKCGRIIDTYGLDYLADGEYAKGLYSICSSVVNEIFIYYGLDPDSDYEPVSEEEITAGDIFEIIELIAVIIIFIIIVAKRSKNGGGKGGRGGFFFVPMGFGGFNSGGFNSGGFNSGGGFGGFSGGGGSFGGGGAGRHF